MWPSLHWRDHQAVGNQDEGAQDACERGALEKSAIAQHTLERHHPIKWEDTVVFTKARRYKELRLKEAFHIQRIQYLPAIILTMILDLNFQVVGEQPSGGFRIRLNSKGPDPPL